MPVLDSEKIIAFDLCWASYPMALAVLLMYVPSRLSSTWLASQPYSAWLCAHARTKTSFCSLQCGRLQMRDNVLMPFLSLILEMPVAAFFAVLSIAPRSLIAKATVTTCCTPGQVKSRSHFLVVSHVEKRKLLPGASFPPIACKCLMVAL